MSMKNSNDTIGNQTRDLLTCSAVPQPTAPPRAHLVYVDIIIIIIIIIIIVSCHKPIFPGTSLEPTVIPTAHASSFTLQYFPYYV
jgi:hypothetical protein